MCYGRLNLKCIPRVSLAHAEVRNEGAHWWAFEKVVTNTIESAQRRVEHFFSE